VNIDGRLRELDGEDYQEKCTRTVEDEEWIVLACKSRLETEFT